VTSTSMSTSGSIISPVSPVSAIGHGSALHRLGTAPSDEALRQSLAYSEPFPSARLPQSLPVQPSSQSSTATYSQPTFGASAAGPPSRTLPQKTTRRTKAHVASACVNCKKKHLGCDPARPCRRCVLSNKEVSSKPESIEFGDSKTKLYSLLASMSHTRNEDDRH
jgi:hypothetical protein